MPPIWLIAIATRAVGSRFAKLASWVVIVLGIILLAFLAVQVWHARDRRIADDAVQLDRADITAAAVNRVLEADRAATANERAQAEQDQQNDREVDDAVRNGTGDDAGAGVRAVIERVRQQQAAGRR